MAKKCLNCGHYANYHISHDKTFAGRCQLMGCECTFMSIEDNSIILCNSCNHSKKLHLISGCAVCRDNGLTEDKICGRVFCYPAPSSEEKEENVFANFLDEMKQIHDQKNHDYSKADNKFSNFEISNELAKHFTDPRDKSFIILIGTKLARLSELLSTEKSPKNESIKDTFRDCANYVVLWALYREKVK